MKFEGQLFNRKSPTKSFGKGLFELKDSRKCLFFTLRLFRTFRVFETPRTARWSSELVVVLVVIVDGVTDLLRGRGQVPLVAEVQLSEVDDHDEGLPVDEVLGDQDLRRRQLANDVPNDATRRRVRVALQDGVPVLLQLLFGSLLGFLDPGVGHRSNGLRQVGRPVQLVGDLEEL